MWQTYLTVAVVAYLLGSIPFGYILVKLFLKQDIRQTGSGNIGATNVARSGKKGLAIATLLLDAAKGAAAVALALPIARLIMPADKSIYLGWQFTHGTGPVSAVYAGVVASSLALTIAPLAALLGHTFPIWLRFKGGKGVATGVGAFLVLGPEAAVTSLLMFAIVFAIFRYVSLASVVASLAFPVLWFKLSRQHVFGSVYLTPVDQPMFWGWRWDYGTWCCLLVLACSVLIILKHHANIRRLLNGTEPKFTTKKKTPDPVQVEKNA